MWPDFVQVIEVPKISVDAIPQRVALRDPQLAEQLVEVPAVVSPSCCLPSRTWLASRRRSQDRVQRRFAEVEDLLEMLAAFSQDRVRRRLGEVFKAQSQDSSSARGGGPQKSFDGFDEEEEAAEEEEETEEMDLEEQPVPASSVMVTAGDPGRVRFKIEGAVGLYHGDGAASPGSPPAQCISSSSSPFCPKNNVNNKKKQQQQHSVAILAQEQLWIEFHLAV